jgi:hypothetical protein
MQMRLDRAQASIAAGPLTAFEVVAAVFGPELDQMMMSWLLTMALCYLTHLERRGRAERVKPSDPQQPERWRALAPTDGRP